MKDDERRALAELKLRLNSAMVPDDVWNTSPFHVRGLHRHTGQLLLDGLGEAGESRAASPIGVVVQGQRGTGKTHLLGWARDRVLREGGYFFLVSLLDARSFWESVVVSMLDSLSRKAQEDGASQLKVFLDRLSSLVEVPRMVRRAVTGNTALTREALDAFVEALRRFDGPLGRESQNTARALVLVASDDLTAQDIGFAYLSSIPEEEPGERASWGLRRGEKSPQEIVRDISRLMALTGPSVIAIDQIDMLIAQSSLAGVSDSEQDWREALVVEQIAGGLMSLREVTRRTLTVVSCLPATWILVEKLATGTVRDRFRQTVQLMTIPDAKVGRALVERRFAAPFRELDFTLPYPTWPVRPSAFEDAPDFTPRELLKIVDRHLHSCLADGEVRELESLRSSPTPGPVVVHRPPVSPQDLAALDVRFAELRDSADVTSATGSTTEDTTMPALLAAGLDAWIVERGDAGRVFGQDPPPSAKPPLHARLRRSLDETTEDEAHWCFRAIATTHGNAALVRLRGASVAAGLDAEVPKRKLFVLRNAEWAKGPRTREVLAEFERTGGRVLRVDDEDLRILAALRDLFAEDPANLRAWLVSRKPTGDVKMFGEALGDEWTVPGQGPGLDGPPPPATFDQPSGRAASQGTEAPGHATVPVEAGHGHTDAEEHPVGPGAGPRTRPDASRAPSVALGRAVADGTSLDIDLESFRKHTAIFAGSGSGKTVLIRRLVEKCALQGVSAIVLDPNNDLARLGDPWPHAPAHWDAGDAARAEEYLAGTDVVVWTPRRSMGRPLSFQPLPDFASVVDNPDEFNEAVEVAVASIVPRVKLEARTAKAQLGQAVLRETLRHYGRRGAGGLRGYIAMLSALPDGVSELDNAERIAADLAQSLTAAMVNDPMFGGEGVPMDPGLLLTPPPGKKARVSVISLVGLQSDYQRQSFVNQLQMALFAWIKKNPAGDRPLGGLFVMDEAQTFAPSGTMTACTQSTLALASQARKYGLGLVFATQAPKGLHNRIPGNAATQFFGLLNSPIQISAAREMAQAKGSDVTDISRLRTGEFYAATAGAAFAKVRIPMCLSHHPKDPLSTEEVIERAGRPMRDSG
ncbi:helicase HerA domain-containing protein [Streptosporangium sp. V21-05]|uniref:helicase HerA domain-containing protein n=1 Tax=Streptosporangium sp. V21-05 TaxID=3446115 RepID=UPI003F52FC4B